MKRIPTIILTCLLVLSFTVYVLAREERSKVEYKEKQTFKSDTEHQKEMKFGPNASITSDKNVYPENFIKNSQLAIWSGGTRWGSGGLASVPDGWYIPDTSTYTGVTRIDVNTIAPVSSVTPPFTHSMYVNVWDGTNASGQSANTKFVLYPDSGVSAAPWWYQKFAGKNVTFGAWVKRDLGQPVASGVTTNFIRPVMNSHSVHLSACSTYWKLGDFVEKNGWSLATVTWDVPATADAFEVGFAMNPTVLAPGVSTETGDSVYVVAPFLLINPLKAEYVSRPGEVIFLKIGLNVWSGGSDFGAQAATDAGTALDLSEDVGWGGIIPDDVEAIYANVGGSFAGVLDADYLYFYGDNILSGTTVCGEVASIRSIFHPMWIPLSSTGTINVDNVNVVTGVTLQVQGVQMR